MYVVARLLERVAIPVCCYVCVQRTHTHTHLGPNTKDSPDISQGSFGAISRAQHKAKKCHEMWNRLKSLNANYNQSSRRCVSSSISRSPLQEGYTCTERDRERKRVSDSRAGNRVSIGKVETQQDPKGVHLGATLPYFFDSGDVSFFCLRALKNEPRIWWKTSKNRRARKRDEFFVSFFKYYFIRR